MAHHPDHDVFNCPDLIWISEGGDGRGGYTGHTHPKPAGLKGMDGAGVDFTVDYRTATPEDIERKNHEAAAWAREHLTPTEPDADLRYALEHLDELNALLRAGYVPPTD